MPRIVSDSALASLNQQTGNQPVIVVGINWGLGISYYSTKTMEIDSYNIKGCILNIGNISNQKRADNFGNCSEVSIEFDDSDGEFKFIADRTIIEKKPIAIFQHFLGNTSGDYILLFYGKIIGPISWSEGNRTLSISATSELESQEFGFSPTEEDFPDLSREAFGIPWPLLFGTVKHVPAVQVRKHTEAILASSISLKSGIYKTVDNKDSNKIILPKLYKSATECDEISIDTEEENILYFEASDSINFPEDKIIKLSIDSVIFEGKYKALTNKFEISKSNIPMYENVKLGERDSNDPVEVSRSHGIPNSGYNVLWLEDDKINLNQKHCYFKTAGQKDQYNFCEAQYGNKCIFKRPFRNLAGKLQLMTSSHLIQEVYSIERSGTEDGVADIIELINEGDSVALIQKLKDIKLSDSGFWNRPSGTKVRLWDQDDPDIYVVSAVPCTSLQSIYAKKKVPLENGKEIDIFAKVPAYYYSVDLVSNYEVNGDFATAVLFYTPLEDRDDSKWDSQIYVSATSSVGPNTAEILRYLLERFSGYGIDDTSFDTVAGKISDVPSHFPLLERGDVLRICQEIAWQARCALVINEEIISLRYLGEQGTPFMVLDESNIQLKSINLGWTETVDIITKLIGSWTPDYQDTERPTRHREKRTAELNAMIRALTEESRATRGQTRITIFKNNIDKFGVIPREERIYIYDNEAAILRTLQFWGYRYSNVWRKIQLKGMLPTLLLQEFDSVVLDFPITGLMSSIIGVVESIVYDPNENDTVIEIWLPSIAGSSVESDVAYG